MLRVKMSSSKRLVWHLYLCVSALNIYQNIKISQMSTSTRCLKVSGGDDTAAFCSPMSCLMTVRLYIIHALVYKYWLLMSSYECNGTNIFMRWKVKCPIQRGEAEWMEHFIFHRMKIFVALHEWKKKTFIICRPVGTKWIVVGQGWILPRNACTIK